MRSGAGIIKIMSDRYAELVINVEAPLESTFHYHVPSDLHEMLAPGHLVEVEFGRRLAQGIVVALDTAAPVEETKPIISLIDRQPVVSPWQIQLAKWMSERYLAPLNACLRLMLPPGLTRWADVTVELNPRWDGTGRLTELQEAINEDPTALAKFETIRAFGAVRMGLIKDVDEAANRQHTPKVAFVAKPADYVSSSGKQVSASEIDLSVRALSMGKLHHAMMGTAAVAIGTAAAIPGTLVNQAAGGGNLTAVRFGHPSGTLRVGAEATQAGQDWTVVKAIMSRSARVLMEGWVRIPGDTF